ncbi:ATP-binding protein [Psychrobacillus sp.]|uniref:ATP-binding protein n=1 Tax=Psychrobacillus sp. TaxID=1871623 RepID=UPI0028BEBBE7|nr:ATP-binding protein [Psychrobacillus sp.]
MNLEILNKKNKVIFLAIISCFTVTHLLLSIFLPLSFTESFFYCCIMHLLLLAFLFSGYNRSPLIRPFLLVVLNIYGLYLNIHGDSIIFLITLTFPIYISLLYRSVLSSITITAITMVEMSMVIYYKYELSYLQTSLNDIIHLSIFLLLLITTSIFYLGIEKKHWITISKQNEMMRQELHSRDSYLQLFFENAKDSIAVFDLNNKVIEANQAFEKLYGWKREEIIGRSIDLVPPKNINAAAERQKEVLNGNSLHFETEDMKKDGSFFDAQITLSPIYDHANKLIASSVITRDVGYKKEAERLLIQSEKLNIAGELAAGVAHEIRNPMTAISGFIQLMNQDKSQPYYEYTKLIASEIERINYIIGEFLVLAKPHVAMSRKYNFKETIDDVIMLFQPELNLKNIKLSKQGLSEDMFIFGEDSRMKQVLINIIKNAVDAIQTNGEISIIGTILSDNGLMIKIIDNGIGMDKVTLEKFFDPFFTTKEKGTGLGMMISQKIIHQHGGNVFIESEQGIGTTITIQLPYQT